MLIDPENSKIPFTAECAEDAKKTLSFRIHLCVLSVLCGEYSLKRAVEKRLGRTLKK